jgi:hypothetical protein
MKVRTFTRANSGPENIVAAVREQIAVAVRCGTTP